MAREKGERTKRRILEAAEELFSKSGFHGASVNRISEKAQVNKALVYYYFKDKNAIVLSLFQEILRDLASSRTPVVDTCAPQGGFANVSDALAEEISFLDRKKRILAVMLMESLKAEDEDMSLFKCVEVAMAASGRDLPRTTGQLVHEFFTGFIPLIAWVTLADKWCAYFRCNKEEALCYFVDAFTASHVQTHPKDENDGTPLP